MKAPFQISDATLHELVELALDSARALGGVRRRGRRSASRSGCRSAPARRPSRPSNTRATRACRSRSTAVSAAATRRHPISRQPRFARRPRRPGTSPASRPKTALPDCRKPISWRASSSDLDLYHPWDLDTAQAIDIAQRCEAAALGVSKQVVNSEGANVYTSAGHFVLANTRGFKAGYPYSRHSIGVAPIAGDASGMQRDDWYTARRACRANWPQPRKSATTHPACARAARRAQAAFAQGARAVRGAAGLRAGRQLRAGGQRRFAVPQVLVPDRCARQAAVRIEHISIHEDPFLRRGQGSSPFDEEGRGGP